MNVEDQNLRYFSITFGVSQIFGALAVVSVAIWMSSFGGGFGWQASPQNEFRYHPLFMVMSLLFLNGETILIYRIFRNESKKITKTAHVALHSLTVLFFAFALKTVFDSHNLASPPIPNLYSLHSWIGLIAVVLFSMQYIFGFVTYFFPGLSYAVRKNFMPLHRFFGLVIFGLAVAASLMGIAEKSAWSVYSKGGNCAEDKFCSEGWIVNLLGCSIIFYALFVIYLAVNPRFKRLPLPED